MSNTIHLIKDKTLRALKGQLGAVSFEYVLIIGGVSVVTVGLLAVGAEQIMGEIINEGLCEGAGRALGSDWHCQHLFHSHPWRIIP